MLVRRNLGFAFPCVSAPLRDEWFFFGIIAKQLFVVPTQNLALWASLLSLLTIYLHHGPKLIDTFSGCDHCSGFIQ